MEIQTFFLALEVRQRGPGDYTAVTACISQFSPPDGEFPLQVRLPYLMLLRRSSQEQTETFTLRFDLIDEDGRLIGAPSNVQASGSFPADHKSLLLSGHIFFVFPLPGCYRLDITADEEVSAHLYSYDLEIGAGSSV
ncbi:MAG TPA: hypothetical protein VN688_09255 [Gemmataceae bacterium]|nr:hypothetical protein [Gemmataceae bacterium]